MTRKRFPKWEDELATTEFRQATMAEFIATFMFLFCTIGCVVFTQDGGITTARQLEVSLVFGGMITILVFIMAGISGGNINPAVSLALAVTKKISPFRCVAYTIAQCLGAICGAGMVRIMTPALFDKVDGGANEISPFASAQVRRGARRRERARADARARSRPHARRAVPDPAPAPPPSSHARPTQEALGVEFGCTFLLVMTVMAATDGVRSKSNAHIGATAPLVVGLAVTVSHFVAIPVDNCSINPARSFGVSVVSGNWNDHAVFWFGPYLGATAAALVYTYVLEPQVEDHPLPPIEASAGGAAGAAPAPPALARKTLPDDEPPRAGAPGKVPAASAPEAVAVDALPNSVNAEWN
jgi:aquaporin PIP